MKYRAYTLLMLLLVSVAGYSIYVNRFNPGISGMLKGVNINTAPRNVTSVLGASSGYSLRQYKSNILLFGEQGIAAINQNGQLEWQLEMANSGLFATSSKNHVVFCEKGGRKAHVLQDGEVSQVIELPDIITSVAVNNKGYSAIVSASSGFKGYVGVYSNFGEKAFGWHSSERNILDAQIANDNINVAASTINTSENRANGEILVFNINEQQPRANYISQDNLFPGIRYVGDGNILAIGETRTILLSSALSVIWEIDYNGRALQYFDFDSDDVFALVLGKFPGESSAVGPGVIEIYGYNGKVKGTYDIEEKLKFLDVYEGNVITNRKGEAVLLSSAAKVIGETNTGKEIRDAALFGGKRNVLAVSGSGFDVVSFD